MKVYELIQKLSKFPANMEVAISNGNEQTYKGDFTVLPFMTDSRVEEVDIGIAECEAEA